jgi:hypothetical protein
MRLIAFAIILVPLGATLIAHLASQRNLQKCWKVHGVTFACYGDGQYDPDRALRKP